MKTSKRILSFFLAVVMVVSTCSVGFTAFAAKNNGTTNSNNDYWNANPEASDAFEALNDLVDAYLPLLLNDPSIKETLETKLGMTVTDETTINDLVGGASLYLVQLLIPQAGKDQVIPNYSPLDDFKYSYLTNPNNKGMDFFQLYSFCTAFKSISDKTNPAIQALQEYCKTTLDGKDDPQTPDVDESKNSLKGLLNAYSEEMAEYGQHMNSMNDQLNNVLMPWVAEAAGSIPPEQFSILKPEYLGEYTITYEGAPTKLKDVPLDKVKNVADFLNDALTDMKSSYTVKDVPTLIYAVTVLMSAPFPNGSSTAQPMLNIGRILNLATEGGAKFSTRPISEKNVQEFDNTNYYEKLTKVYTFDQFLADQNISKDEFNAMNDFDKSLQDSQYELAIFDKLALCIFDLDINTAAMGSSNYDKMCKGLLKAAKPEGTDIDALIEKEYITADQIKAIHEIAAKESWVNNKPLDKYLTSNDCVLTSSARTAISLLSDFDRSSLAKAFANNTVNDLASTDGIVNLGSMKIIDRINYVIPSILCNNVLGKEYNISSDSNFSSYIDPLNAYSALFDIKAVTSRIEAKGISYSYENFKFKDIKDNDGNILVSHDDVMVEAVNNLINAQVIKYLGNFIVNSIINGLLTTKVNLKDELVNVWSNLYKQPIETIFNLIPTVTILVDELIIPLVLTHPDSDSAGLNNLLKGFLLGESGPLYQYSQTAGDTTVGIGSLMFDLNLIAPAVVDWILGDHASADVAAVGTYTGDIYDNNVPKFTNVYAADKAIYGITVGQTLRDKLVATGMDAQTAQGLDEIITKVLTTVSGSLDKYLAEHKNDERHNSSGKVAQKGLNNLFVSIPQLNDYIGKAIITDYSINSDWTSLYDGKIVEVKGHTLFKKWVDDQNSTLNSLKNLVSGDDAAEVLNVFVDILIGNWLNSVLDFANDTTADESNKLTSELPLVFGLLNSLGGLGEKSIISDVLNGLFQMKRSDESSLTLKEQDATKFVGFSNEAGLFLLSNLQFTTESGEERGLVPLIMSLAGKGANTTNAANSAQANTFSAPLAINSREIASRAASVHSELLTNENIALADDLVSKLDKILSTLLSDITVNGKNITDLSGLDSALVNMLIQAIGPVNASDLVNKVLVEYVRIVTNETYDSDTLSAFVINTYAVIENIVDYLFYDKDQPLLPQDSYRLVADAVTGLVSPDSVAVRMTEKNYGKTIEVLQTAEYLRWNDIKVKLDNGDKNILKFNVNNEDSFNDALAESFNGISAIFAAILKDSLTTTGTNLYSDVYYPIIGSLLQGVMPIDKYNSDNTTNSERLVGSFIAPINNLIRSITQPNAKPATEILNLIAGIAGVANDTTIANALNGVVGVMDDEINGVLNIVGQLSPTFQAMLKAIIDPKINPIKDQIKSFAFDAQGNQKQDIVMSMVNSLLALTTGIKLPNFDLEALANTKGKPGETLLVLLDYAITAITSDDVLDKLLQSKYPGIKDILSKLTATQIVEILNQVIAEVQDPTEIYWAFTQYANKLLGKFAYPQGIFPADAQKAVGQLDDIVKNIFPLLKELGILNVNSLADLVNNNLYTNANLTAIAKGLYNALSGEISKGVKIGDITKAFGIDPSPAGVAQYLNDTSYGATFSSAAQTLYSVGSWNDVKSINWGFTDGSGMAKTGFVNGLSAILRPFNNLLAALLVEGQLTVDVEGLVNTLSSINVTFDNGSLANGILTINTSGNTIQIALANTAREIATIINEGRIHIGANGYESAIIPLLEAFMINNLKTYNDYTRDYNAAKDNLLINILNPVVNFIDKVAAAPFDTLTGVLPNVALFVDGYGVSQFLYNLLAPIVSDNGILGILNKNGIDVNIIINNLLGTDLATYIQSEKVLNANVGLRLDITKLDECNIHEILIPLVNSLLSKQGIVLNNIDWKQLASHGDLTTARSAAMNADGQYTTRQIVNVNKGEALIGILRYISNVLINNAKSINKLVSGIDAIKKDATLKGILGSIFDQIDLAQADDIIRAIFFFLLNEGDNAYFDYSNFKYEDFEFSFGNMDEEFCRQLAPMLDGLIGGVINLNDTVTKALYNDAMISTIATGLYKAVEGVKVSDQIGSLTHLLSLTGIDFSTSNVANLLVNEDYGQKYEDASKTIKSAGSWAKVNADSLKWGVTDRDTFLHALAAVLRPVYGVLDVLLNNGSLNLFNLVSIPGSDGYTSFLVPIMEAFGLYNIKTQYQYREDIFNEYDNILLDVLNPLFDKLEDIIAAPIQTLTDILPNLALVFANDGLIQIINNILTPVSAMLNAIRPIVNANDLLAALNVNIPSMLASIGIKGNFVVDVYDLPGTLTPLLGSTSVTNLLNGILGTVKINGALLGVVLPEINWYQLASHGEVILDGTSQVACHGMRISVKSDQDETLIALLRFIVNTVNYENNYDAICSLVGGLVGGADASVSDMVGQVLGMLQGDADAVIEDIVSLLKDLAG